KPGIQPRAVRQVPSTGTPARGLRTGLQTLAHCRVAEGAHCENPAVRRLTGTPRTGSSGQTIPRPTPRTARLDEQGPAYQWRPADHDVATRSALRRRARDRTPVPPGDGNR